MNGRSGWMNGGNFTCSGLTANFFDNIATVSGGAFEVVNGTLNSNSCDWLFNSPKTL